MRHVLGVLGVLAAGVLLAVSAAMNWRFGFSLGKTEMDGQIYGAASAAADCMKALVPFFFFAAIKNRVWSQAAAAALVWTVVTGYSMTSALGHAALNRFDSTGQRAVQAATYKDLRADMSRAQEQLGWVPQHRPVDTVKSELQSLKDQRPWSWTNGCTDVKGKTGREFCQKFHALNAELASAEEADKLETRIGEISAKLAKGAGGTVMAEADPQAAVLHQLTGFDIETVQTGLAMFVALLLEIGSGFGLYVAFAQWRLYDQAAPKLAEPVAERRRVVVADAEAEPMPAPAEEPVEAIPLAPVAEPAAARVFANDNSGRMIAQKMIPPASTIERYYKERIASAEPGSSVKSSEMYEDYCLWCESLAKEPMSHPGFSREFNTLGVKKSRIGNRTRYHGIVLRSALEAEKDRPKAGPTRQAA
ncbi:MAG: hypothetical protein AB7K67_10200 [Hyphomicrobiaceae bacterium]